MRVLVLRPREQGCATAERLVALGHEAVLAPVLTVEATNAPAPSGPFDGIVLTSANALPGFRSLGQAASGLPVWVVGSRLAEALAAEGVGAVRTAPDASALAGAILAEPRPGRLLLVAGHDRKAEPQASLARAGIAVAVWESYRAAASGTLPDQACAALREGSLGAVLHYSRRSAAVALDLVRQAGLAPDFAALRQLCLSRDVAAGLAGLDPARIELAAQPDEASLLALLGEAVTPGAPGSRVARSGC